MSFNLFMEKYGKLVTYAAKRVWHKDISADEEDIAQEIFALVPDYLKKYSVEEGISEEEFILKHGDKIKNFIWQRSWNVAARLNAERNFTTKLSLDFDSDIGEGVRNLSLNKVNISDGRLNVLDNLITKEFTEAPDTILNQVKKALYYSGVYFDNGKINLEQLSKEVGMPPYVLRNYLTRLENELFLEREK